MVLPSGGMGKGKPPIGMSGVIKRPKIARLIARSTTLGCLMYAAPAWWGFASAADIDRFISRTIRMGYLQLLTIDASAMVADTEDRLLAAISSCSNHGLQPVFPPLIKTSSWA